MTTDERFEAWHASQPYAPCDGCDEDTAVCDLQRVVVVEGVVKLLCWECVEGGDE